MTTPGSNGPGEPPPGGPAGWGQPAGPPQQPAFGQQPAGPPQQPAGGQQPPQGPPAPGAYPPPQGQYPQPGQPGQPGQYPPPQGQFPPGQQPWAQGTPPARNNTKILAIGGAVLAVLVIAILALAFLGSGDPEAGDCLKQDGQELSVVDCDSSEAAYKLLGIQDGQQSYDEYLADPNTCQAFPESTQSFWIGENGDTSGQGDVYCVTTP